MRRLRFHVTSLPHTQVSKVYCACAYTMKVYNFCKMMRMLGHHVTLYAPEGSDTSICDDFVQTISTAEQRKFFGEYDWHVKMFNIEWRSELPYWTLTNLRAAAEIASRAEKGDMVCLVTSCQKQLGDNLDQGKVAVVEPFIGYNGVCARFQVYESYTHQAAIAMKDAIYGRRSQKDDPNGSHEHDVVPVYFDKDDFPAGDGLGDEKGPYYVYLGRLITRKGIQIAEKTCKTIGARLVIAGQGVKEWDGNEHRLVTDEGNFSQTFQGEHIDYVGFADVKRRAALLGGAVAAFTPTIYFEPGGNTSVEPQACGTPVLASNFGCFTQQVVNGVGGYRPTTLDEWVWAAKAAAKMDRKAIREQAIANHSLEAVAPLFDRYFQRVFNIFTAQGWDTIDPPLGSFACYR